MTEDQAKPRTVLYGLLFCSIAISLSSMFLSWQSTAERNRRSEEIRQELTKLEKKLEELEAKAATRETKGTAVDDGVISERTGER